MLPLDMKRKRKRKKKRKKLKNTIRFLMILMIILNLIIQMNFLNLLRIKENIIRCDPRFFS